jgi:hypothetical protein
MAFTIVFYPDLPEPCDKCRKIGGAMFVIHSRVGRGRLAERSTIFIHDSCLEVGTAKAKSKSEVIHGKTDDRGGQAKH